MLVHRSAWVALALVLALPLLANAGDLSSSRWDTTYDSPDGPVHAIVTFNGGTGKYVLDDGSSGRLSNVKYFEQGDTWLITGKWSYQGASGAIQFNKEGASGFQGGWLFDPPNAGQGGKWRGKLLSPPQ